tara:strand:- start:208 stop:873 length:666 start_codon:yes stop_codon:yes gene_type:complete
MQKVNEIVITIYATIFYVLTSKFGLLVPFSKIISKNLKINLLAVETIIFGFMFYIFFRIGYSIIGFKFGLEAFNIGAGNTPDPSGQDEWLPPDADNLEPWKKEKIDAFLIDNYRDVQCGSSKTWCSGTAVCVPDIQQDAAYYQSNCELEETALEELEIDVLRERAIEVGVVLGIRDAVDGNGLTRNPKDDLINLIMGKRRRGTNGCRDKCARAFEDWENCD